MTSTINNIGALVEFLMSTDIVYDLLVIALMTTLISRLSWKDRVYQLIKRTKRGHINRDWRQVLALTC